MGAATTNIEFLRATALVLHCIAQADGGELEQGGLHISGRNRLVQRA